MPETCFNPHIDSGSALQYFLGGCACLLSAIFFLPGDLARPARFTFLLLYLFRKLFDLVFMAFSLNTRIMIGRILLFAAAGGMWLAALRAATTTVCR